MFLEPTSQVWTPSDPSVTVTDNTDYSIDDSSKKLIWSDAVNETVTITFDSIDLSQYEELVFHLTQRNMLTPGDLFQVEIDGQAFAFEGTKNRGWNFIVIDCSQMGNVTEIIITSLVADLYLFIDVLGVRKVTHTRDTDLLLAFKNTITLDYDVETTLSADLGASDTSISLASKAYVTNTSVLEIDDGTNTVEVQLEDRNGALKEAPGMGFSSGDAVRVVCPTLMTAHDDIEPDPVCGVSFYDKEVGIDVISANMKNGMAEKIYTGALGVIVFIDCSSEKKLLQLAREYDYVYGERFKILLDGELVFVELETSQYVENVIGNNPRIAYFYMVEPQPFTRLKAIEINTINFTLDSDPVSNIL